MPAWQRVRGPATFAIGGALILFGVIRLGIVCWSAWSDNVEHDKARDTFIADCEAKMTPEHCAQRVDEDDDACFFSSGLSSAQAWGRADYQRCMWVGETAYLKARALKHAARRNRYRDITD